MQTLSAYGRTDSAAVIAEIGLEPAIEVNEDRQRDFDRRRVSFRWLFGTILTGLCGAGLITAAIYAALDHQSNFAEAPSIAVEIHKDSGDTGINPHKGDRLVKAVDIVAAKQSFKAPTAIKIGDKEVVKTYTFTHVETTLLTASAGFADEVPLFNPLKLLADARDPVEAPAPEPQTGDADVSWSMRDLPVQALSMKAVLTSEEVEAQVAETIKNATQVGSQPIALPAQLLLMRTSRANLGNALSYASPSDPITAPFSSIEVRMVPENVTVMPRTTPPHQVTQMDERLAVVRHGESFEETLLHAGVPRTTIAAVVAALAPKNGEAPVAEGRRLKLLFADLDGSGKNMQLARLSVYDGETLETVVAVTDQGGYVRVNDFETAAAKKPAAENDDDDDNAMRLYNSLYETALKQEIPHDIIDDLIRIFANDVDLQRSVSSGDSFEALYDNGDAEHHPELLYASITTRNETYRYFRFQTPDDGVIDFYDPTGKSSRKFLMRVPIIGARVTSGFGERYHPILGYTRMHTGTDFAAPIGTPVFAAGNGTIMSIGWDSGYGRRIEIQHANGYETTYNHLSSFARGIHEGERVRQGQVIAYLGQSGLATGPHLHYEVLVNGHFVDPMRVKLARTREISGLVLADFKREKDRILSLLARAPNANPVIAERQDNKPDK